MRKTAFHAAVNYYCRQLGIVLYNTPIPLAFADRDTHEIITPGDEEVEPPESPLPPDRKDDGSSVHHKEKDRSTMLGFLPPREDGIPSGMRPRKAKSRKAMNRQFGEF